MPTAIKTISAKYAGVCKRTGKEYPVGTRIVQGEKGWEIAPGVVVAEWRQVQTPEGNAKSTNINFPLYCRCCKERPNFAEEFKAFEKANPKDGINPAWSEHQYKREGDKLICPSARAY